MADDLELEQELLMVAGRNRGAPASGGGKRPRARRASDSEDEDDDDLFGSDDSEEEGKRSRKTAKGKGKGGAPASKKARGGRGRDEESEGGSGSEDDEGDGYGSDLYIDDDDRRKLEAMTMLEREMILADRAEQRDKQRQRKALLKSAKDKEADKNRAAAAGGRQSSRQRGRQADKADKDSAIRQIRAARKRQQKQAAGRKGKGARDWSESDDEEGSSGDEDEGEEEFRPSDEEQSEDGEAASAGRGERDREEERERVAADAAAAAAAREEEAVAEAAGVAADERRAGIAAPTRRYDDDDDYEDVDKEDAGEDELRSIQVLRSQLEAWFDQPFFTSEGITGLIVRMAYGTAQAAAAGEAQYMLFLIHDLKEGGKPYAFGTRQVMTNKYLVLLDGLGNQHTMAMLNVSNSPLTHEEVARYQRHCSRSQRKPLSKLDVQEGKRKMDAALNYRWDADKVREVLKAKRAAGQLPVNVAQEKSRLRRLLEDAQMRGAEDEAAQVEEQLRALDTRAMQAQGSQRIYGMSHINKRNQTINFNTAFRNVSNVPQGAGGSNAAKGGSDPFSRRATRPAIYWRTGQATQPSEEEKEAAAAALAASKRSMEVTKLSQRQMKMDPSELIKQLDISIDLGLLGAVGAGAGVGLNSSSNPVASLGRKLLGRRWQALLGRNQPELADKGVLTIDDWKQRAGF